MNTLNQTVLTKSQSKQYLAEWQEGKNCYSMTATVRHDDQCGNGHNTFSITADIRENGKEYMGGCCHEEITKRIPELAPYIKWHLTSTDGPMHYIANTVYTAGERDCHGLRKGEFRQHTSRGPFQNGGVAGVPNWVLKLPSGMEKDVYSATKPAPVTLEWEAYGRTGEGKARELDAARNAAVWPEATDGELSVEPDELKAALEARLPKLMEEFQAAVESLGLVY